MIILRLISGWTYLQVRIICLNIYSTASQPVQLSFSKNSACEPQKELIGLYLDDKIHWCIQQSFYISYLIGPMYFFECHYTETHKNIYICVIGLIFKISKNIYFNLNLYKLSWKCWRLILYSNSLNIYPTIEKS